jgi:hypothetical protein
MMCFPKRKVRESMNPLRGCQGQAPRLAARANRTDSARTGIVVGTSRRRGIRRSYMIQGRQNVHLSDMALIPKPTTGDRSYGGRYLGRRYVAGDRLSLRKMIVNRSSMR